MTLIVTAANANFVVMVSDRRLTRERRGKRTIFKEEENKSILWDTPDGRILVAYTGIARLGGRPMDLVLMELLAESTEASDFQLDASMHRFREAITAKLALLNRSERRLTVMFSGFVSSDGMRTASFGFCMVTNFQDWDSGLDSPFAWDDFTIRFWYPRPGLAEPFDFVQYAGDYRAIPVGEEDQLRPLLNEDRPPHAVVDKLVTLFHGWADRSEVIGKQLSSTVLRVTAIDQPTSAYHSMVDSRKYYGTAVVKCRPGVGSLMVGGVEMTAEGEGPPTVVPATHPRRPCTCGSGKRYRDCHGAMNPHNPPWLGRDDGGH